MHVTGYTVCHKLIKHPTRKTVLHLFIISLPHKPGWTAVQCPSLLVVMLDQPPHTLDQLVLYDHQSLLSESLHHQTTRELITAHCTHIMVISPLTPCTREQCPLFLVDLPLR